MATSDYLINIETRRQVMLERYKAGQVAAIMPLLSSVAKDIRNRLLTQDLTDLSRARQNRLLADVAELAQAGFERITAEARQGMLSLAVDEAAFEAKALERAIVGFESVVPAPAQIQAAALAAPMSVRGTAGTGKLLDPWLKGWTAAQVEAIEGTIRLGFYEGRTNQDMIRNVVGTLSRRFQDGDFQRIQRSAEALVRTGVQHTASVARAETLAENGVEKYRIIATLDGRTSPVCQSLDQQVFVMGKGPMPPFHPNCLTGDVNITSSGDITGVSKRWFDGEICTIKTSGGRVLTCTPNHPVLTSAGWIAAGLLNSGHQIVCDLGIEWKTGGDAKYDDRPTTVSDIAEAFFATSGVSAVPVPVTSPHFHGDGAGSEVAIIGANSRLLAEGNAALGKEVSKSRLVSGNCAGLAFSPLDKFFAAGLAASGSVMRSFGQTLDFLRTGSIHAGFLLVRAAPLLAPVLRKYKAYGVRANLEAFGDSADSLPVIEQVDNDRLIDVFDGKFRFRLDLDAASRQAVEDDAMPDTELASHFLGGHAGAIELDSVINNVRSGFSGHVYNLETVDGCYVANGIVTHNCRTSFVAELPSDFDFLREGSTRASKDGYVDADKSYYSWIKDQPKQFQDEALGPTWAKLLRDGGLDAETFAKERLGKDFLPVTLEEMREKLPAIFERAGV